LNGGADRAAAAVITSMFNMATKGRTSYVKFQAARYWLAARCGSRDSNKAVTLAELIPINQMSREQFDRFLVINGEEPCGLDPVPAAGNGAVVPFRRRR